MSNIVELLNKRDADLKEGVPLSWEEFLDVYLIWNDNLNKYFVYSREWEEFGPFYTEEVATEKLISVWSPEVITKEFVN